MSDCRGAARRAVCIRAILISRFLPDAPTLVEVGYRDLVVQSWIGVFAPAGTLEVTVDALGKSISTALKGDAVAEGFAKLGIVVADASRQRLSAMVHDDLQRWGRVVKASGFTIEE